MLLSSDHELETVEESSFADISTNDISIGDISAGDSCPPSNMVSPAMAKSLKQMKGTKENVRPKTPSTPHGARRAGERTSSKRVK